MAVWWSRSGYPLPDAAPCSLNRPVTPFCISSHPQLICSSLPLPFLSQRVASLPLSEPSAQAASVHWAPTLGRPCDLVAAAHGTSVDVFSITGDTSALQVGWGRGE